MEEAPNQFGQEPVVKSGAVRDPLDIVKLTRHVCFGGVALAGASATAAQFQPVEWASFFRVFAAVGAAGAVSCGLFALFDGLNEIKQSKERADFIRRGAAIAALGLVCLAIALPAVFWFTPAANLFNHERSDLGKKEQGLGSSDRPTKSEPSVLPLAPVAELPAKTERPPLPPAPTAEKPIEIRPAVQIDKGPPTPPPASGEGGGISPAPNEASGAPMSPPQSRLPVISARKSEPLPASPSLFSFYKGEPRNVCGQSQLTIRRSMRSGWVLYSTDILSTLREVPLVVGQPVTVGDCELTLHPIEPDSPRFDFDLKALGNSK